MGVLLEFDELFGAVLPTECPHPHIADGTSSELNLDFLETVDHEDNCELWNAMQHNLIGHHSHNTQDTLTQTFDFIDDVTKGQVGMISNGEDAFVLSPHH